MSKVNKIFKVDASMIPVFILLIITGIGIHISSENGSHHSWIIWSVVHVVCAVAFLILGYFHVKQHIGWFKTLLKGNFWGHFHWIVGIILAIIGTGHYIKRFRRLKKGFQNK